MHFTDEEPTIANSHDCQGMPDVIRGLGCKLKCVVQPAIFLFLHSKTSAFRRLPGCVNSHIHRTSVMLLKRKLCTKYA